MPVTLYGAAYSTYTRSALLALHEKSVAYTLAEVDIFKPLPPEHLARHPWGKIPVLEHEGFRLYETAAILRYIDEAFPGPDLQPAAARDRARMMQVFGIIDSYGYPAIITTLFVQRALRQPPDEDAIAGAVPEAEKALDAIIAIKGDDPWLAGSFSLADLHLVPILAYLRMTSDGQTMLRARPALTAWWDAVSQRPSVNATRSPLEK